MSFQQGIITKKKFEPNNQSVCVRLFLVAAAWHKIIWLN